MLSLIFAALVNLAYADDAVTEAPVAPPVTTVTTDPTKPPETVVTPPAEKTPVVRPQPQAKISDSVAKVSQIFRDKKKVAATLDSSNDAAPRTLVFTDAKGEACEGIVEQTQGDMAFIDFSNCANFDRITAGSKLTLSQFESFAPPPMPSRESDIEAARELEHWERKPSRWNHLRPSLSVGYDTGANAHFNNVNYTAGGSTVSGSETLDVGAATDVSLGLMWARQRAWGFLANLSFESRRNVKGADFHANGSDTDFTYDSPQPTMKLTIIEANALYRWGFLYLPFGLNYTMVSVNASGSDEWVQASGGVGGQVGVGFIVGEFFHFEMMSQFIALNVKSAGFGGSTDLGSGTLSGLILRAGVVF
jgi:hypothetical protein